MVGVRRAVFAMLVCLLGLLASLPPARAWAEPYTSIIARPFSDFAQVSDVDSTARIEQALHAHQDATGTQIALLTLASVNEPIEDFALRTATKWGGGTREHDNGILVVLLVKDRRSRIEVGYGLESVVTDSVARAILDSAKPELVAGDYAAALAKIANQLITRTGGEQQISLAARRKIVGPEAPVRFSDPPTPPSNSADGFDYFFMFILGFILVVFFIGMMTQAHRGKETFSSSGSSSGWSGSSSSFGSSSSSFGSSSSLFGSSSSSSSSSSFGSSSSSSSSRGYSGGGGGFGGGGASSSW